MEDKEEDNEFDDLIAQELAALEISALDSDGEDDINVTVDSQQDDLIKLDESISKYLTFIKSRGDAAETFTDETNTLVDAINKADHNKEELLKEKLKDALENHSENLMNLHTRVLHELEVEDEKDEKRIAQRSSNEQELVLDIVRKDHSGLVEELEEKAREQLYHLQIKQAAEEEQARMENKKNRQKQEKIEQIYVEKREIKLLEANKFQEENEKRHEDFIKALKKNLALKEETINQQHVLIKKSLNKRTQEEKQKLDMLQKEKEEILLVRKNAAALLIQKNFKRYCVQKVVKKELQLLKTKRLQKENEKQLWIQKQKERQVIKDEAIRVAEEIKKQEKLKRDKEKLLRINKKEQTSLRVSSQLSSAPLHEQLSSPSSQLSSPPLHDITTPDSVALQESTEKSSNDVNQHFKENDISSVNDVSDLIGSDGKLESIPTHSHCVNQKTHEQKGFNHEPVIEQKEELAIEGNCQVKKEPKSSSYSDPEVLKIVENTELNSEPVCSPVEASKGNEKMTHHISKEFERTLHGEMNKVVLNETIKNCEETPKNVAATPLVEKLDFIADNDMNTPCIESNNTVSEVNDSNISTTNVVSDDILVMKTFDKDENMLKEVHTENLSDQQSKINTNSQFDITVYVSSTQMKGNLPLTNEFDEESTFRSKTMNVTSPRDLNSTESSLHNEISGKQTTTELYHSSQNENEYTDLKLINSPKLTTFEMDLNFPADQLSNDSTSEIDSHLSLKTELKRSEVPNHMLQLYDEWANLAQNSQQPTDDDIDITKSENAVSLITEDFADSLDKPNLQCLVLHKNSTTEFNRSFCQLKFLFMQYCQLSSFFISAPTITILDLSFNNLTSLNGLKGLISLAVLNIAHNKVTRITSLKSCIKLQYLNLDGNQIISIKGLQYFSSLMVLSCENNHISSVEEIHHCSLLIELNANGNNICEVPPLKNNVLLQKLFLNNNNISSANGLERYWLPSLHKVSLAGNSLNNLPMLRNMISLEYINLENNLLNDFKVFGQLKECYNLIDINVKDNLIVTAADVTATNFRERIQAILPCLQRINSISCNRSDMETTTIRNPMTDICKEQSHEIEALFKNVHLEYSSCLDKRQEDMLGLFYNQIRYWRNLKLMLTGYLQVHQNILKEEQFKKSIQASHFIKHQVENTVNDSINNSPAHVECLPLDHNKSTISKFQQQSEAAVHIQSTYRGYKVRKAYLSLKVSSKHDVIGDDLSDDSDFDYEEDVNLDDLTDDRLLDEWCPSKTLQLPQSHYPLPDIHKKHYLDHQVKAAWATPSPSLSSNVYIPSTATSETSPDRLSVHSYASKKAETISNEWGFQNEATAELMLKRARKMGKKKQKPKNPEQRYQLFKKSSKSVNDIEVTSRKQYADRKSYFEGHTSPPSNTNIDTKQMTYSWVHNQAVLHQDRTDDLIRDESNIRCDEKTSIKKHDSESLLFPRIDESILRGKPPSLIQSEIHNPKPPSKQRTTSGSANIRKRIISNTVKSHSAPSPVERTQPNFHLEGKNKEDKWKQCAYR